MKQRKGLIAFLFLCGYALGVLSGPTLITAIKCKFGRVTVTKKFEPNGQLRSIVVSQYNWPAFPEMRTTFEQYYDDYGKTCKEQYDVEIDGWQMDHISLLRNFYVDYYVKNDKLQDILKPAVQAEGRAKLAQERARFCLPYPKE